MGQSLTLPRGNIYAIWEDCDGFADWGGGDDHADDYFTTGLRQSAQRPWRVLNNISCSGSFGIGDHRYLPRPKETVGNSGYSFDRKLDFVLFNYDIFYCFINLIILSVHSYFFQVHISP